MDVLTVIGAEHVVNSSLPIFNEDILTTVKATGATVVFDATGCGTLAIDMLISLTHEAMTRLKMTPRRTYDELVPSARRHHTEHSSDDFPPPAVGREGC